MIADLDSAKRVAYRALTRYAADHDAALTFVKYRENYVFRVDEPGGSYALRLHRSGYRHVRVGFRRGAARRHWTSLRRRGAG